MYGGYGGYGGYGYLQKSFYTPVFPQNVFEKIKHFRKNIFFSKTNSWHAPDFFGGSTIHTLHRVHCRGKTRLFAKCICKCMEAPLRAGVFIARWRRRCVARCTSPVTDLNRPLVYRCALWVEQDCGTALAVLKTAICRGPSEVFAATGKIAPHRSCILCVHLCVGLKTQ